MLFPRTRQETHRTRSRSKGCFVRSFYTPVVAFLDDDDDCKLMKRRVWVLLLVALVPLYFASMQFQLLLNIAYWEERSNITRNELASFAAPLPFLSSSNQLDDLLSTYNLSTALLHRSYPNLTVPNANQSIAFIHIGKTGGSTIAMNLARGCRQNNMKLCCKTFQSKFCSGKKCYQTATSRRVERYFHMQDIPPDKLSRFTTIVTVVRNPITRFMSAFAYEHPDNALVTNVTIDTQSIQKYSCFPSLRYLIRAGMGHAEIPWNMAYMRNERSKQQRGIVMKQNDEHLIRYNCTEMALVAFGHYYNVSLWQSHMSWNYRRYYQSMPIDKELIVMRDKHLYSDWVKVNELLSGDDAAGYSSNEAPPPPFKENVRNVSSNYHTKEKWTTHTPEEQQWLCSLLYDEIRKYIMILSRAINLNDDDLLEALEDVNEKCVSTKLVDRA